MPRAMLPRSLVLTLRTLSRQPLYAAVNVAGLALGLACSLAILTYAAHELRYDRHHPDFERVYRVAVDRHYDDGQHVAYATSSPPLAAALRAEVPEVEAAARLFSPRWTTRHSRLAAGDRHVRTDDLYYGDPDILTLLHFETVAGDAAAALARPDGLVLSEHLAASLFGEENPLGQRVEVDERLVLTVGAVVADPPGSTHASVRALAPLAALAPHYGRLLDMWGWDLAYTYIRLAPGADRRDAASGVAAVLERHAAAPAATMGMRYTAVLQPVSSIHLRSHRQWELAPGSRAAYPYALLAAGLGVLLIALLTFWNLTTARGRQRGRAVALHRMLGGRRRQLIWHLSTEGFVLGACAGLAAAALLAVAAPWLEAALGFPSALPLPPLALAAAVGLASGGIGMLVALPPALAITRRPPMLAATAHPGSGRRTRQGLVLAQFAASIVLIAVALGAGRQIAFLGAHDPGFPADRLLAVDASGVPVTDAMRDAIAAIPGVQAVTASSGLPGEAVDQMRVRPAGATATLPVAMLFVDDAFVETLQLEVAAGRGFSRAHPGDAGAAFVINEAAARAFGWDDPVGRRLVWPSASGAREGDVIGVVRDFQVASLRQPVQPLVMVSGGTPRFLTLRIDPDLEGDVLPAVHRAWVAHAPHRPLEVTFLDARLAAAYGADVRFARALRAFAALALLVACVGLFGLAAFTAERRAREVSIRRVVGATIPQVAVLLTREYLGLLVAAFLVATPLAHVALSRWLAGFALHAAPGAGLFIMAGGIALAVALAAVFGQALRAASRDPVLVLQTE
jgi:putative ABC transport system permease protein